MTRPIVTPFSQFLSILASIIAVMFWSAKPIYITVLKDSYSAEQIFMMAGLISVVAGIMIAALRHRSTVPLLTQPGARTVCGYAIKAGLFLALWYWAFYKGLQGDTPVEVVIISFAWPLVCILSFRLFAPTLQRRLDRWEYPLVLVAFIGAGLTAQGSTGDPTLIVFAVLAAIGAGMYLPFAVMAINEATKITGHKIAASFYATLFMNIVALAAGLVLLAVTQQLDLPAQWPSWFELLILTAIGLGTYLVAEILWCYALSSTDNPSIAALAFLSPGLSILILHLGFQQPISVWALLGLLAILATNLLLHFKVVQHVLTPKRLKVMLEKR